MWLPLVHPTQMNLACNPGMRPDWELNKQPFCPQAGAESTEPHQPGLNEEGLKQFLVQYNKQNKMLGFIIAVVFKFCSS